MSCAYSVAAALLVSLSYEEEKQLSGCAGSSRELVSSCYVHIRSTWVPGDLGGESRPQ